MPPQAAAAVEEQERTENKVNNATLVAGSFESSDIAQQHQSEMEQEGAAAVTENDKVPPPTMKQEDTEDESLEALAQQLDTITGAVSRGAQASTEAAASSNSASNTTCTTTTRNSTSKDDVSVLIPGKITLTCRLNEHESLESKWGFSMGQQEVGGHDRDQEDDDDDGIPIRPSPKTTRVIITDVTDTSPLASLWATGAVIVLEKVNRRVCTSLQQTHIWIAKTKIKMSRGATVPVTLECRVVHHDNNSHDSENNYNRLVQVWVDKPTTETTLGIRLGNTVAENSNDTDDSNCNNNNDNNNDENEQPPPPPVMLLTVQEIVRGGLLGQSGLRTGDLILALQGKPCHDMECDDAANYLKSCAGHVSILALQPAQNGNNTWWRHAKRAAVGVGGGTMVGVGLVFIPTLPPPFGEVLIAGGVSLLAKEFEGPKRVVKSCRDKLETAVGGREEGQTTTAQGGRETTDEGTFENNQDDADAIRARAAAIIASTENSSGGNNNNDTVESSPNTVQRRSMKDRLKNFGRRHVLPFLDGIVGDQEKESQTPTSKTANTSNTKWRDTSTTSSTTDGYLNVSSDDEPDKDGEESEDEDDAEDYDDALVDSDDDDYSWLNVDVAEGTVSGATSEATTAKA
eukprot:scaffold438_cov167-Amphora_coffeaeformis.AAC.3